MILHRTPYFTLAVSQGSHFRAPYWNPCICFLYFSPYLQNRLGGNPGGKREKQAAALTGVSRCHTGCSLPRLMSGEGESTTCKNRSTSGKSTRPWWISCFAEDWGQTRWAQNEVRMQQAYGGWWYSGPPHCFPLLEQYGKMTILGMVTNYRLLKFWRNIFPKHAFKVMLGPPDCCSSTEASASISCAYPHETCFYTYFSKVKCTIWFM